MSTGGNYYALTLSAKGASNAAYFALTPRPNLTISQGSATMHPSSAATAAIIVTIEPQMLEITAPAGTLNAGVTIITNEDTIAGTVEVDPPVNVATVITLYGAGGAQLGQHIIDPAVATGDFSFPLPASAAIPDPGAVRDVIRQKAAGPQS